MKKLGIVTLLVVSASFLGNSFAEHAVAPTAAEQQTVAPAPTVAKSPWSVKGFLSTERAAKGKLQDTISNNMFLDVRRSILDGLVNGLKVGVRVAGQNNFKPDLKKLGWERYYRLFDPAVIVAKPLFDVSGFQGIGELRYYVPVSPDSRLSDRNPSHGSVRTIVAVEKNIGKWTVGTYNFVQRDAFKSEDNALKKSSNAKYRVANELSLAYHLTDKVALQTAVGAEKSWAHLPVDNSGALEWSSGLGLTPVSGLSVDAVVALTAPNQSIAKFLETVDTRRENTAVRLDVSYSFL